MSDWFQSGRIVEAILLLMLLEAAWLLWRRDRHVSGPTLADLLPTLASGGFLLLAVRAALGTWPWPVIAVALAGAGVCHLLDLRRRWHRA